MKNEVRTPGLRSLSTLFRSRRQDRSSANSQVLTQVSGAEEASREFRRVLEGTTNHAQPPTNRQNSPPDPLPAELWIQIIREHSCRKAWSRLAATCRFFREIAQACLFEKLDLSGPQSFPPVDLFRTRPELGAFVRDLTFITTGVIYSTNTLRPSDLLSMLEYLPSLNNLRVEYLAITADVCYALHHHPHLSTVEFWNCTFMLEAPARTVHPKNEFSSSPISSMRILYPRGRFSSPERVWETLIPVKLRSLSLELVQPETPWTNLILLSVMTAQTSQWLETLKIDVVPKSIVPFLAASPMLRYLSMRSQVDAATCRNFCSLPVDAIPLLEHYDGPAQLSKSLLRSRPVRSVALYHNAGVTSRDYLDTLASLHLSSAAAIEVELWITKMGPWLWDLPTTIVRLVFNCQSFWDSDETDIIEWLSGLSHLTNLHTLYFRGFRQVRPGLTQEEMTQISKACPSLRELALMGDLWNMASAGVWKCRRGR